MSDAVNSTRGKQSQTASVAPHSRLFLLGALVLLVIGGALRVYHLGVRSLWYDEALTANISRGTLTQMLAETRFHGSAPILHPCILYLVERNGEGAEAVRIPSVLASLLAVFMMIAMVRVKVSRNAALFSAAILAVSASQIRYAQEVREYSLSVLFATLLVFSLLHWEVDGSRNRQPVLLYTALFLAPFVQYGLVFLAFGVLTTIGLRLLFTRDTSFQLSHLMIASACLAAGGLLSFSLTLRFQYHPGGIWYLAANYFDPKTTNLPGFLVTNTRGLLNFFFPAQAMTLCFVVGTVVFCIVQARTRKVDSITLLAFSSVLITMFASVMRVYPYGGVRQCLFLSPVLGLFAGTVFAGLLQWHSGSLRRPAVVIGLLALILLLGYRGILKVWPYGEYEDTVSILKELRRSSGPNDQVWVNHDAAAALQFYLRGQDRRVIYGKYHPNPQEYVPEFLGSVDRRSDRVWLVFSHLQQPSDRAEEQLIVSSLRSAWDVEPVMAPTNAALYVAHPRVSP